MDTLNLHAMLQPIPDHGLFRSPGYYCWGPNLIRGEDGRCYMACSRWPQETGKPGWLTHSEIALAVADDPDGPFEDLCVLLRGRGAGYWDELMAHNPKLKCFDGRYFLYYISSRSGPTRGHIRDSQCTGVAVADRITGPYERLEEPLVMPSPPIHNVAVNPGVTRMRDGRYLLIIKGDIHAKTPSEPMPQRIQAIGIAEKPTGPFVLEQRPAIADIDTEDASVWYDHARDCYYAVFHAHTYIGLIASEDGLAWRPAEHPTVTGKALALANGGTLEPDRLERPSVFVEDGQPRVLCLGAACGDDWLCVLAPLVSDSE